MDPPHTIILIKENTHNYTVWISYATYVLSNLYPWPIDRDFNMSLHFCQNVIAVHNRQVAFLAIILCTVPSHDNMVKVIVEIFTMDIT